uniref:Uncharacterized protein n=1 Tax=Arion vulgaris TaxID=1028688 RepID=A0A0B7BB81_9EUPU
MAASPSAPPSYNDSLQQGHGYQSYQPSYGTVGAQQQGVYHPGGMGYPPAGEYDPNKPAGAYPPGPYPPCPYPPQGSYPTQAGYTSPTGAVPSYGQSHTMFMCIRPRQLYL